ncbi:MAG: hypothetical protein GX556_00735 [Fibrobacter sp.]|nr:hypothetical protein [Fibrobacter sp.]
MKRFSLLASFFVLTFFLNGSAQMYRWSGDSLPSSVSLRHYLMGGVSWIDVDDLNSRLDGLGLTEFSSHNLTVGYGWDMIYDRILTGGQVEALLWRSNTDEGTKSTLWSGELVINAGFQVLSSDKMFLYPIVGLGLGMTSLWVGAQQVPFGTALTTPANDNLYQFTMVINLGAGFDYMLPTWKGHKSCIVGVRAGYMFDPIRNTDWRREGTEVTGGPDVNLQGPYIQAILGKAMSWPKKK